MSDESAQDRKRTSLSADYEVRYWTHELGVTKDEIVQLWSDSVLSRSDRCS